MYKVDGILIDNKSVKIKEKYIASVSFEDLLEICSLGNVAINRSVEEKRAQKMTQYIMQERSFYPPIVVSSSFDNTLKYDENTNKIIINIDKAEQRLTIIDGQHRYLSIAYLLKNAENREYHSKRKQSIFIINNIDEYEQRKIFMDINDNANRVKAGTKLRFEKSISNYFSLILLDEVIDFSTIVKLDLNQTSDFTSIPYKYIVCLNNGLLQELSEEFNNGTKKMDDIKGYKESFLEIWTHIKMIIDKCITTEKKIITNEAIFIALGKRLGKFYYNDKFDLDGIKDYLNLFVNNIDDISEKYFSASLKAKAQKEEKLIKLLEELGN